MSVRSVIKTKKGVRENSKLKHSNGNNKPKCLSEVWFRKKQEFDFISLELSVFMYGARVWTACRQDEGRIRAAEMKFMTIAVDSIRLAYKTNLYIIKGLNARVTTEINTNYTANSKKY
jgi:hypothetical protein